MPLGFLFSVCVRQHAACIKERGGIRGIPKFLAQHHLLMHFVRRYGGGPTIGWCVHQPVSKAGIRVTLTPALLH
jgi:hypothetical protein